MQTKQFANGDRMPVLGLGTWKSAPGDAYGAVKAALRVGYRHIDCAPIYGNEAEVGKALSESFAEGIVSREEVWVTSKLWNSAHAPEDVRPGLEQTLADLQLEYLDLYLIHWPVALKPGKKLPESGADFVSLDELPLASTWTAMEPLVEAGLCRHIGVSNFSVTKLRSLLDSSQRPPEMNQIELHPYLQQPEMLDFCEANGIFLTAYSPLGSSDRVEAMKEPEEPVLLEDPVVLLVAERRTVTPAQVLIAWALNRGTVTIPKSVNPERIAQNLAAAEVSLTEEDMQEIGTLNRDRRYVNGKFWTMAGSPYTLATLWDE